MGTGYECWDRQGSWPLSGSQWTESFEGTGDWGDPIYSEPMKGPIATGSPLERLERPQRPAWSRPATKLVDTLDPRGRTADYFRHGIRLKGLSPMAADSCFSGGAKDQFALPFGS